MSISKNNLNNLLYFILFLSAVFWATASTSDPDLWGHTKYGLDILEQGRLLRNDIYSYSVPGAVWTNHEWLSEIIFGFIYKLCGFRGMLTLKILLGLLTLFLIYKTIALNTRNIFERSVIFITIAFLMSPYLSMLRPQNFSFLFIAAYIYICDRTYLTEKRAIPFYLLLPLPFIMIFWVNMHGGFLSGIGLAALFLTGYSIEKRHLDPKLLIVFLAVLCSTLINPYGYKLYKYLYNDLIIPRISIVEWECLDPKYIIQWIYIGLSVLVLILSDKKKPFTLLLLFFATLYLGLRYLKFFPFFLISSAMVIPFFAEDLLRNKYEIISDHPKPLSKTKTSILLCAFFLLAAAIFIKIIFEFKQPFPTKKADYPVDAVNYMKKNGIKGNLLVNFNWAQYAIWNLYPGCRVFYDGRHRTVYPLELEKKYFNYHFINKDWDEIIYSYPPDIILWEAGTAHAGLLKGKKEWEEIYSDTTAVLLRKKP